MNEKLLTRVQNLLTKAASSRFPAEAEAFNEKAAELMATYGITEALLAAAAGVGANDITTLDIKMSNPFSLEKATLLHVISKAMRCEAIAHRVSRSITHSSVVGFPVDLERVELLFTGLLLQAVTQVTRHTGPLPTGISPAMYRRSWFTGFNVAVQNRLQAAEHRAAEEATAGSPGTALVLRDRSALVSERYNEMFTSTFSLKSTTRSSAGYHNGRTAGERADLGGTRLGGGRRSVNA